MFKNFLYLFKNYFQMIREEQVTNKRQSKYYGWNDVHWSSFMVAMMQRLEPRQFLPAEIIYHDMEEVNEIMFVQTGDVSAFQK